MRPADQQRRARPHVLVVVVVGSALVALAAARFVTRAELWLDEALSVNISTLPMGEIASQLRRDGHPPLFYWLLHGWTSVFGTGDLAARALPAAFGVCALPLAYIAGRKLAGTSGGLATLMIAAALPYWVRYSTEVRMYSLVMLLVLTGQLLVRAALVRPGAAKLVGLACVSGALLLSHYWSLYLVASAVIVVGARAWRRRDRAAAKVAVALAAGAVLFLPWLPVFFDQLAHTGTPWAEPFRPTTVIAVTIVDLGGFSAEAALVGVVVLGLAVVGVFGARREHAVMLSTRPSSEVSGEAAVVALTMMLGATVAFVTGSAYASRYASVVVPLITLLAGVGVSHLPSKRSQAAALAGVVLVSVPGIAYNTLDNRTQAGEVVATINRAAAPGDFVVYCPDQLGPAGSRHMREDVRGVVYPTGASPALVDWTDYEQRNESADPEAFAGRILADASGHAIYLVSMGGYRTFDDQCERLEGALGSARDSKLLVVAAQRYFEPMNLTAFVERP